MISKLGKQFELINRNTVSKSSITASKEKHRQRTVTRNPGCMFHSIVTGSNLSKCVKLSPSMPLQGTNCNMKDEYPYHLFIYRALGNIWRNQAGVMPCHSHFYGGARPVRLLGLAMRLPSYHHWMGNFLYPYKLIDWHWRSSYFPPHQPDHASQVLDDPGTPGNQLPPHSAGKEEPIIVRKRKPAGKEAPNCQM